jgi:hypothetical protein
MQRILLPVVAALGLATGCYTQGDVGVGYSYGYAAPAPSMYYVSPGVSVVAYSDYPVFYSDNYYWRYDSGLWYRSSYHGGGWVVWHDVPYRVRTIDRPHRYARYDGRWSRPAPGYQRSHQGGAYVRDQRTYSAPRTHNAPPPAARDHRTQRAPAPAAAPATRDHRAPAAAPAARDHRTPAPAPRSSGPAVRDHRRR